MWIRSANKFAKFHGKRFNQSENIPKFFFLGGGYFFETPYIMPAVNSLRSLYTGVCEGRGPFSLAL